MQAWSVVVCKAQREVQASVEIAALGFEVFFPVHTYERTIRNHRQKVTSPLFPRYIFAKFDRMEDDWGQILKRKGVLDILRNENLPVIVKSDLIEKIRAYRPPVEAAKGQQVYTLHQPVTITNGPLQGVQALFEGSDRKRTKAFLQMLVMKITVPFESLSAA